MFRLLHLLLNSSSKLPPNQFLFKNCPNPFKKSQKTMSAQFLKFSISTFNFEIWWRQVRSNPAIDRFSRDMAHYPLHRNILCLRTTFSTLGFSKLMQYHLKEQLQWNERIFFRFKRGKTFFYIRKKALDWGRPCKRLLILKAPSFLWPLCINEFFCNEKCQKL